jgi:hypothetical protein
VAHRLAEQAVHSIEVLPRLDRLRCAADHGWLGMDVDVVTPARDRLAVGARAGIVLLPLSHHR